MGILSFGAMISYLMIVQDSLSVLVTSLLQTITTINDPTTTYDQDDFDDDVWWWTRLLFLLTCATIILPLSCLRDMADLDKSSRFAVGLDLALVLLVIGNAIGLAVMNHDSIPNTNVGLDMVSSTEPVIPNDGVPEEDAWEFVHWSTLFVGLGVLSFAFECQEASFLVAGSLDNPSIDRWSWVTRHGLAFCALCMGSMGIAGYTTYQLDTQGNILNNLTALSITPMLAPLAHAMLGVTMICVYPLNLFVARHVLIVLLLEGPQAHEGNDDSSLLARKDRRIIITCGLFLATLLPACWFRDIGFVLAIAGTVGGSCLAYIGPGMLYLGVHGGRFLELIHANPWLSPVPVTNTESKVRRGGRRRGRTSSSFDDEEEIDIDSQENVKTKKSSKQLTVAVETTPLVSNQEEADDFVQKRKDGKLQDHLNESALPLWFRWSRCTVWYVTGMPIWYAVAKRGRSGLTKHVHQLVMKSPYPIRIGNVEFTLTSILDDGRVDAHAGEGAAVLRGQQAFQQSHSEGFEEETNGQPRLNPSSSNSSLPFLGKEALLQKRLSERLQEVAPDLEPDPQEEPPAAGDFVVAIFYVCFGVLALCVGLFSLYSTA